MSLEILFNTVEKLQLRWRGSMKYENLSQFRYFAGQEAVAKAWKVGTLAIVGKPFNLFPP